MKQNQLQGSGPVTYKIHSNSLLTSSQGSELVIPYTKVNRKV